MSEIQERSVYEALLSSDWSLALDEADQFFVGRGVVHSAVRKIAWYLDSMSVPYAVTDGMALFYYGLRQFNDRVEILVRCGDVDRIYDNAVSGGFYRPNDSINIVRDEQYGVAVRFKITGDYPGDGRPKPVAFPDPIAASVVHDGIRYLTRTALIEVKLASGMTNPGRIRDLADVQELIKAAKLPRELADELNLYVRDKYLELWTDQPDPVHDRLMRDV